MTPTFVVIAPAEGLIAQMADALVEGLRVDGRDLRRRLAPGSPAPADPLALQPFEIADLRGADALAVGTDVDAQEPTRAAVEVLDAGTALWNSGELSQLVATSFTSLPRGSEEADRTVSAINHRLWLWGAILVPAGYGVDRASNWLDNRIGAEPDPDDPNRPDDATVRSVERQGLRLSELARLIARHARQADALKL